MLQRYYLAGGNRQLRKWWAAARSSINAAPAFARQLLEVPPAAVVDVSYEQVLEFWQWARQLPGWRDQDAPIRLIDREDARWQGSLQRGLTGAHIDQAMRHFMFMHMMETVLKAAYFTTRALDHERWQTDLVYPGDSAADDELICTAYGEDPTDSLRAAIEEAIRRTDDMIKADQEHASGDLGG